MKVRIDKPLSHRAENKTPEATEEVRSGTPHLPIGNTIIIQYLREKITLDKYLSLQQGSAYYKWLKLHKVSEH
jgi:hypothetical protein